MRLGAYRGIHCTSKSLGGGEPWHSHIPIPGSTGTPGANMVPRARGSSWLWWSLSSPAQLQRDLTGRS